MEQHKNLNSVMESGNHFKNGASPKSHTSRKNITSLIVGIIISSVTVIGLTSCPDRKDCETKKSPYDCKNWCMKNILTEGAQYNESTGECCCY